MPTITISERTGASFAGIASANLRSNAPTSNFLGGGAFEVTEFFTGDYKHNLFVISDNTGLSGSITVSGADFKVRCADATSSTQDFALINVTAAATASQATWNNRTTGSAWTVAGGFTQGQTDATDVNITAIATASNATVGSDLTFTGAGLDTLLSQLLSGSISEVRLLMVRTDAVNDFTFAEFRGVGDTSLGPIITIPYTTATSGPPVSTVGPGSANEGSPVTHTVTLSAATTGIENYPASLAGSGTYPAVNGVNFSTSLSGCTFSNGVTFSGGDLVIPSGVTVFTVQVPTTNAGIDNNNLTYNLNVGGITGIGTIVNIAPLPSVSVNNATQSGSDVTFTVTLSTASGRSTSVNYATRNGSKSSPGDYTATSGTLTFTAGVTSLDVVVAIP